MEYIEGENNDLVEQLDELTAEHEKLKAKEQESQVAKVELQKKFSTLAFELEQKLKLSGEALAENQIEMQQMQATVGQNIMTITSQVTNRHLIFFFTEFIRFYWAKRPRYCIHTVNFFE